MKRQQIVFIYQLLVGASDTTTGVLLLVAPALTLHLMRLHPTAAALPYLAYIGAFVLSVGLGCFYGAWLATRTLFATKLEVVWLLTGMTRTCVSLFVLANIFTGTLETGWLSVALSDGAIALIQFTGIAQGWLTRGWLHDVAQ
jgi:hypothetical protein